VLMSIVLSVQLARQNIGDIKIAHTAGRSISAIRPDIEAIRRVGLGVAEILVELLRDPLVAVRDCRSLSRPG
jgi:hypothetical protein